MGSLLFLLLPKSASDKYIAEIYQKGRLIERIPLYEITESRIFYIRDENGRTNEIEIRPGQIGIRSADCPDKLCVSQGFISDSTLPITCLPNRLVIRLRNASQAESPDMITY
jgi:hypothetical protein